LLRQSKQEQEKFAALGVGVPCSRCGQLVTAKHAEQERRRVAGEVRELERAVKSARIDEKNASDAKQKAEITRDWLGALTPLVSQLTPAWRERAVILDMAAVRVISAFCFASVAVKS
jgi:hypothetical protein